MMKVELLDYTGDAEYKLGLHASECYDSRTDRDACLKRAAHCVDTGHLSVLRFCHATLKISGISRVCSHQLVRVAHAGILMASQRYIKQSSIEYIDPPSLLDINPDDRHEWKQIQARAETLYLNLVNTGQMKKEDARFILPQGCTTSLRICMNFQGFLDFLSNRDSKHAQWEIRALAQEVRQVLIGIAPNIFTKKGDA